MFDFVDINHIVYDKAKQQRLFKYDNGIIHGAFFL